MAGCFGNSAEDRHFERQLISHLAAEEKAEMRAAQIEDEKEALWGSMASTITAERLDCDWEILNGSEGSLLATIAFMRKNRDPENLAWAAAQLVGIVDKKLATVAQHNVEEQD